MNKPSIIKNPAFRLGALTCMSLMSYLLLSEILFLLSSLALAPAIFICFSEWMFISSVLENKGFKNLNKRGILNKISLKVYKGTFTMVSYCIVFAVMTALFSMKMYKKDMTFTLDLDEPLTTVAYPPRTFSPPPPPPEPEVKAEIKPNVDLNKINIVNQKVVEEPIKETFDTEDIDEVPDIIEPEPDVILPIAEYQPQFPGGDNALYKFLKNNLKYPHQAIEMDIEGNVVLQFVVNKNGEIDDIKVVKSLGGGCDEEAIRVVESMPKWKPGRQLGRKVSVRFHLPVSFRMFN